MMLDIFKRLGIISLINKYRLDKPNGGRESRASCIDQLTGRHTIIIKADK